MIPNCKKDYSITTDDVIGNGWNTNLTNILGNGNFRSYYYNGNLEPQESIEISLTPLYGFLMLRVWRPNMEYYKTWSVMAMNRWSFCHGEILSRVPGDSNLEVSFIDSTKYYEATAIFVKNIGNIAVNYKMMRQQILAI